MPGIHDAHTHFLLAGLQVNSLCKLPFGGTQNDIIRALETCAVGLGDNDWLVAGYYYVDQFESGKLDRWVLDSAFPDRPVYIHEFSAHHGLANSTALKEAGVNAETVDPPGGSFKKMLRDNLLESSSRRRLGLFSSISLNYLRTLI